MSIINAFPGGGAAKYIHSKSGTAHSFTGAGKLGFAVLTADYADGDSISVNGAAMTVVGDESALVNTGSVLFAVDGSTMYLYEVANPLVIPNGETILPANDVETWLACAGVRYESVGSPNLATTVASETLMTTLVNSDNAMAYLIRSTVLQAAVYGSAAAIAALDASTPFVTPIMIGSVPSGYSVTHTGNGNTPGRDAFSTASGAWWFGVGAGRYVQINLPTSIWPYKITGNATASGTWYIQGSADGGNTWTTIKSTFTGLGGDTGAYMMSAGTVQKMNRFRVYVNSSTSEPMLRAIQFYGKE